MPIVDIVLVSAVLVFALMGLAFGFIHTLGNIVGALAGIFVGSRATGLVVQYLGISGGGAQTLIFILAFLVTSRLVGILFWIAQKFFNMFAWIMFGGIIDKLLGGVLGLIEGVLIVGIIVFYAVQVLPPETLRLAIEHSFIAKQLLNSVSLLELLFPKELRTAML